MAGVKITDLPILSEPATDDVLYIVDATDNTSKQISFGNVKGALDIDSGLFTPTATDLVGLDSVNIYEGTWLRVGESVTFGFYFETQLLGGNTTGSFTIDLPQIINNFAIQKSNSWLCTESQKPLGTEAVAAGQNDGTQSVTIGINGYDAGTGGKANFIGIYKR